MGKFKALLRSFLDVRPGEYARTIFMSLYLLFVLFAYYILKPVSRALFLNKFDIDKLPWLYVLIAAVGGVLAYLYTKLAVRFSLKAAVTGATVLSCACLVAIKFLLALEQAWVYYFFNIWVSLFSIVLVSQGWLVAANVFDSREAKRLYGILGVGAVFGAAFGGSFTAAVVEIVGTANLLLASAGMVLLSYGAFLVVAAQKGVSLAGAKAAEEEVEEFAFRDIVRAIRRYRHLQVIIAIITITYIVDVLVEYQFSAMAKIKYPDKEDLTAFFGNFYGLWLNLLTFVLQFFLTAGVVSRFGVGGTLQIMPVSIGLASIATLLSPSVLSTAAARLAEAATRYSFNRTGMELLYLPLPGELKNRTKAFVDIFVDRLSRGMGGMLLVLLTTVIMLEPQHISILVLILAAAWIFLSRRAQREYIDTVRGRLERRRLDLESARITVRDRATIALLEQTLESRNPRQVAYALSLLATVPNYQIQKHLDRFVENGAPEVRAKVFEVARQSKHPALLDQALREMRMTRAGERNPAVLPAVDYALAVAPDSPDLARRLLDHPNVDVAEAAVRAILANGGHPGLLEASWVAEAAKAERPSRRRLAALAVRAVQDASEELRALLADADPTVVSAALETAAVVQRREFLDMLLRRLAEPHLRGPAIKALAAFGGRISGTLSDVMVDPAVPITVRRQIPRVLQNIPEQRSVDVLLGNIAQEDLSLRGAVLRALNHLRERAPNLHYGGESVMEQIHAEARQYYELSASLAPFRDQSDRRTAAGLLASTLQERLRRTIERLFGLLGLRYPQREIYAAYMAVNRGRSEDLTTALEFLDNVLDRELKRVLLPLLDAPELASDRARELYGLPRKDAESALRDLLDSGDPWLVACAVATAAELGVVGLRNEIEKLTRGSGTEVALVADSALKGLV